MKWRAASAGLAAGAAFALVSILLIYLNPFAYGQVGQFAQQQRGKYLATVGDCTACHTAERGQYMAGGRPIETPFGIIYSPNLTSDGETGIGSWTSEQFYRAMHDGIAPDGHRYYPAFPYPWFTKATREDIDDIRAYLRTVPAVKSRPPANTFPWPLSQRVVMRGWNWLFFKSGSFQPDAGKSPEWNRGGYLVESLAHCGACHSPRNFLGATNWSKSFQGSDIQDWFAPNLTSKPRIGLSGWTESDVVAFLKTGHNGRAVAYGPMAQVVEDSTSKLSDSDLKAIATYLKSLPAAGAESSAKAPERSAAGAGMAIYVDRCSACHQSNGEGVPGLFPALKGSTIVQSPSATTMIRLILNGGHGAKTRDAPTGPSMPAFDWQLSDEQIADVASFVRNSWGNAAATVSAGDVNGLRSRVSAAKAER